jgi:lysophospholipase L1-like esterase
MYSFSRFKVFLVIMLSGTYTLSGQPLVDLDKTYNLVKDEVNVIQNAAHLDDFFEKLQQLKATGRSKINIVHIGDSHIQADFLTDVVRKNFQREFGNAGRGLIVPGRVAGTNEPFNIRTFSADPWQAKRCIYPQQPLPIGIGGITLNTEQPGATISVRMNDPLCDYSFNTVTLFYQNDITSFNFSILDSTTRELASIGPSAGDSFKDYSRITLPFPVNEIAIRAIKPGDSQKHATIFGMNLENGKDGILYHAIGVNGAKYIHYNAAQHFARQTQALEPDLFIISLGTNESIDYPYIDKSFSQQIAKLVQSLSEYNPQARFILVTPPDSFRRKIKYNPGIETIREQIIQYAVENGLAFWDMYKINGGRHSATEWKMQGLLRPDGVHFSKDGYVYQGNLLYEAIMKRYNQYAPVRHP